MIVLIRLWIVFKNTLLSIFIMNKILKNKYSPATWYAKIFATATCDYGIGMFLIWDFCIAYMQHG